MNSKQKQTHKQTHKRVGCVNLNSIRGNHGFMNTNFEIGVRVEKSSIHSTQIVYTVEAIDRKNGSCRN